MSFIDIALQCCDAGDYLSKGAECAQDNVCYGDLRPIGDYLWFSIPSRLGLPDKSLIAANFAVAAIGLLLSVFALRKLLSAVHNVTLSKSALLILLLLSACIHAIFLLPTIFNTLSDPPASMALLSGIWLLVLAHYNANVAARILQFFLGGLCLGLAVWLRAFYLYPVLAGLVVYMLLWIFSSKKKREELLVFLALLPIGVQFFVMHQMYGTYGYLGEESTSRWARAHLNTPYIGYDTIFPRDGYFWSPQHCAATYGIQNGLAEGKFSEVSCVLAERLYFYLGTYETQTYKFTSVKNKLNSKFAENIGDLESQWWAADFEWRGDVALSPYGEKTVDQLTIKKSAPGGNGDIVQWIPLRGGKPHTFSVWLWSPVAKTVNLSIARHYNPVSVASKQITLSPEPTRYSVTGITPSDALYDVDIGLSTFAAGIPTTFGTEVGDTLYAWGAQLEVGDQMTGYDAKEVARPDSVRVWRPALVVLNVSMLMFVLIAIIRARTFWFQRRAGICILVIIFAAAAESLAIIPEQRFATGWMIFFWLIATTFIFMQAKESTKKHRIHS